MQQQSRIAEALRWYVEAGVDEFVDDVPLDWFAQRGAPAAAPPAAEPRRAEVAAEYPASPPPPRSDEPIAPPAVARPATEIAPAANLDALRELVEAFDGCALKRTASRTVFGVGNPGAKLMLVGEAPGAEEDRLGVPFVGASGQLLDRMLGSIGLRRDDVYIANTLYWRPPGNRTPTPAETIACLPFLLRQIELVGPQILVLVGSPAAKLLLGRSEGVMRLRGEWFAYQTQGLPHPIPTRATFHPAFLLRSPGRKREAWRDLLAIDEKLQQVNAKLASGGPSD